MSDRHLIAAFIIVAICCSDNNPSPHSVATQSGDKRWNLDERIRKYQELIDHAQAAAHTVVADYEPESSVQVNELNTSIVEAISGLPGVISVTASKTAQPGSRIIHLISSAVPSKDDFLIALKQMADGGVSQNQLTSLYDEYLLQIKLMRIEHLVIVRCLAKRHGLVRIYVESTTRRDVVLSQDGAESDRHASVVERAVNNRLIVGSTEYWIDSLQSGVPDEYQQWVVKDVLPFDSETVSTEPVFKPINDVWKIAHQRSGRTMDSEVQMMLTGDTCCLIVGDANDFSESVNRVAVGRCEYIRIQTKWWQALSPLDPNVWGR